MKTKAEFYMNYPDTPEGTYEEYVYASTMPKSHECGYINMQNKHSYVYFVLAGDKIKIGKTNNIAQRFKQIQIDTNTPPTLLFAMPFLDEHQIHERFYHLLSHGKWFYADAEIFEFIKELKKMSYPH